jgi:hypothetical protein
MSGTVFGTGGAQVTPGAGATKVAALSEVTRRSGCQGNTTTGVAGQPYR